MDVGLFASISLFAFYGHVAGVRLFVVLRSLLCRDIDAFKPCFVLFSCSSATHCFQKRMSINETW